MSNNHYSLVIGLERKNGGINSIAYTMDCVRNSFKAISPHKLYGGYPYDDGGYATEDSVSFDVIVDEDTLARGIKTLKRLLNQESIIVFGGKKQGMYYIPSAIPSITGIFTLADNPLERVRKDFRNAGIGYSIRLSNDQWDYIDQSHGYGHVTYLDFDGKLPIADTMIRNFCLSDTVKHGIVNSAML